MRLDSIRTPNAGEKLNEQMASLSHIGEFKIIKQVEVYSVNWLRPSKDFTTLSAGC